MSVELVPDAIRLTILLMRIIVLNQYLKVEDIEEVIGYSKRLCNM